MRDPRYRSYTIGPIRPNIPIPDAQARALDRRQALDEQQRQFRASGPALPSLNDL